MSTRRSISREIGTALAVLAIYLLTLLAPLHEARASQLAFEKLGYATLQTGWVLCNAAGNSDRDTVSVSKCPAAGIGKPALLAPSLAAVALDLRAGMLAAPRTTPLALAAPRPIAPPAGPRAPPEQV